MGGQHPRSHIVAPANAGKKSNGQGHVEDEFCSCWCKGTPSPMPISQVYDIVHCGTVSGIVYFGTVSGIIYLQSVLI